MLNIRILLIFVLFLSGCKGNKNTKKNLKVKNKFYTLYIYGVECALCAKKAVIALESVPSVAYAEYICHDQDYTNCYAKLYMKHKDAALPIQIIRQKLQEVGFGVDQEK